MTRADYAEAFRPILEEAKREGRRIRILQHFGQAFEGFTPGGAWEDVRIGVKHLRLFDRCAVVSDVEWLRDASRFVGALLPCSVKVFANEQMKDAMPWNGWRGPISAPRS